MLRLIISMHTGPRNLVVRYSPIGGSFQWRLTPLEYSHETDLWQRRKEREDECGVEGHIYGCGSCTLAKVCSTLEGEEALGLNDSANVCGEALRKRHEENLEYLKDNLAYLRNRILAADDKLREAVIDIGANRSLARQIFSPKSCDGPFYSHTMLQTALFDTLASMLVGHVRDEPQEFLTSPLTYDPPSLTTHMDTLRKWPVTITKFANIVNQNVKVENTTWPKLSDLSDPQSRAVTSLLITAARGEPNMEMSALSYNLTMASLGLAALMIASSKGSPINGGEQLYEILWLDIQLYPSDNG